MLEVGTVILFRTLIRYRRDFSSIAFCFFFSSSCCFIFFQAVTDLFYFTEIVPDSDLRDDSGHHSDYHSGS